MKRKINLSVLLLSLILLSCEKVLKVDFSNTPIQQVLICNFYPGSTFQVSLSASKLPDDYSSVHFLENNTVELYEDGTYVETLPYLYKDSSTGYGFYTSTHLAVPGKTYTVKTSDAEGLPGVTATEYLPETLSLSSFRLEQYPDSSNPSRLGILSFDINDDGLLKDYYFVSVYYYISRPKIKNGDTTWVDDYLFNQSPLTASDYPNPSRSWRNYFTDSLFNGRHSSFSFEFPGLVNSTYREITFVFELSHIGKNFFDYYSAFVSKNANNINAGFGDPVPLVSNIENGYGHFSAQNSTYYTIRIK